MSLGIASNFLNQASPEVATHDRPLFAWHQVLLWSDVASLLGLRKLIGRLPADRWIAR